MPCWNPIMSYINLSAAEWRSSHGDKNPELQLVPDLHREYYSQENELCGFQDSVGSRTLFVCDMQSLKDSTVGVELP